MYCKYVRISQQFFLELRTPLNALSSIIGVSTPTAMNRTRRGCPYHRNKGVNSRLGGTPRCVASRGANRLCGGGGGGGGFRFCYSPWNYILHLRNFSNIKKSLRGKYRFLTSFSLPPLSLNPEKPLDGDCKVPAPFAIKLRGRRF
jgi:hypothetical protein